MTRPAVTLYAGDCLDVLRQMSAASVDAVVTDPPYGLSFMGKRWDYDVPSVDIWAECLRVLKPGGHLLAFAGTRTQHRMAVRIEDAGFEIRDMIAWVYGSGFPKSLDVSKAIDKANGRRFEDRYALGRHIRERREACGFTRAQVNAWFGYVDGCEHWERQDRNGARVPTLADWRILRDRLGLSGEWSELVERAEAEREVIGQSIAQDFSEDRPIPIAAQGKTSTAHAMIDITAPATNAARQWAGWGTALKPALEPITVARKPLAGTVAETVLAYGTGAIHVDGCRVTDGTETDREKPAYLANNQNSVYGAGMGGGAWANTKGRWPANLVHDGGPEVADLLGEAARFFYCAKASRSDREAGCDGLPQTIQQSVAHGDKQHGTLPYTNEPRKITPRPRGNNHPTVKPTDLMRYLCRLVTQPGGVVLDPFMGSGSTGRGAVLEGFAFVGVERDPEYLAIARARIASAQKEAAAAAPQPTLFDHVSD